MSTSIDYGRLPSEAEVRHYRDENDVEESAFEDEEAVPVMSKEERKRIWWWNAGVNMAFISLWFIIAIVLSVYNKWMFSPDRYGFSWPLFVTTFHFFAQFAFAAAVRYTWPSKFKPLHNPNKRDYLGKAVPTAVATGLDIGLSNLSLKLITLSFYTMCKSSSLIFVLTFAFFFKLEKFSLRLVGVILLIFIGVLMMVAAETKFILSGFILVTTASALGGLRWSLTHLLLKNDKMGMNNPAATIFWLAPVMGVTLCTISVFLEDWSSIFASRFFDTSQHILSTTVYLAIPGTMAFCMVLTEYYIIQRAGVVPMSIAGIAKEVTQISVSAWLFGDELTPLNIVGVGVTVCGIALFTYHKYRKSVDSQFVPDGDSSQLRRDYAVLGPSLELEERDPLTIPGTPGDDRDAYERYKGPPIANGNGRAQVLFDVENDGVGKGDERGDTPISSSTRKVEFVPLPVQYTGSGAGPATGMERTHFS